MSSNRVQDAHNLFQRAIELHTEQRDAFLADECGDDAELCAEVKSLLQADSEVNDAFMKPPVEGLAVSEENPPEHPSSLIGNRVGKFHILRELGRGGMGAVYEAEQDHPRRNVALKLIQANIAKPDLLRRLEQEANILGWLQHPGIAQIYDAGTANIGNGLQPFFVMERVDGLPLSDYAVERKLSIRDRLDLFVKVCQAVDHAHQKGVIHRDLKPGNILVTGDGQPKILDFGIARTTDADLRTTTLETNVGQLLGTIPYMSPEQVSGNPRELDTRSDVYALGVILYELLAGRLPLDLSKKMIHEAVRIIREDDPVPLSSVNRMLQGDVETIVAKALEKDKTRRYQSASDLSGDVRRYLADEPISARPASAIYQLRKFAKRNKVFIGAISVVFAVLVVGIIATSISLSHQAEQRRIAQEAQQETQKSLALAQTRTEELQAVTQFQQSMLSGINARKVGVALITDLRDQVRTSLEEENASSEDADAVLASFAQTLSRVNSTNVALKLIDEQVLGRAIEPIEQDFADQPLLQATLQQTLGDTYRAIGLFTRAQPLYEQALATRREELGNDHTHTLWSLSNLSVLLHEQGKVDEAEVYCHEALDGHRRLLGDEHRDTLSLVNNMGSMLQTQGKLAEAEPYLREALEVSQRILGERHRDTLTSANNLGSLLQEQGRLQEAEPYLRQAMEGSRQVLGDEHAETLTSIENMAHLLHDKGKLTEAEMLYRETLGGRRRVLGDEHIETLVSIINLGGLLTELGKFSEAEILYSEAAGTSRRVLGERHPETLTSLINTGNLLEAQGKLTEAEVIYREALTGCRLGMSDEHPLTLTSISKLGSLLASQDRMTEAEPYYREALDKRRKVLGDEHPKTVLSIHMMAGLLRARGKLNEAEERGAEAVARGRKTLASAPGDLSVVLTSYGTTLVKLKRYEDAEAALLEAHRILRAAFGAEDKRTLGATSTLVKLYRTWDNYEPDKGHGDKAAEWRAKLTAQTPPSTLDSKPHQNSEPPPNE